MGLLGMGNGMGANEAMFKAALQSSAMETPSAQLMLLLPRDVLHQALVPSGHLAEIAQKCQIRIDLGAEVPPNMCQVAFTGSVAGNAMAAYFLQERCVQHGS